MRSPTSSPPPVSRINSATRSQATGVMPQSAPRSKRCEASVCMPWRLAMRRMIAGSNHADSISTFVVFSMITEKTTNVLIESAWFDPAIIRRMAKRHGMHTDASHRFERGADWGVAPLACDRVTELILESAGGELPGGQIDVVARILEPATIALHLSQVSRILGIDLDEDEIQRILGRLGFGVTRASGGDFSVQIPTWRLDVEREVDLLEELARIHGYNQFPNTLPAFRGAVETLPDEPKDAQVRDTMLALGYNEAISITFISEQEANIFGGG